MNKTSSILKPYLRKFILQTHPDFFHNDSIKKQTNAASLQKLYNVLQTDSNSSTCKLEFFTKDQKSVKKNKQQQPKAVARFEPKESEWTKANSFFNLCQQVEIPILQSDLDMVKDMISKEANKDKPKGQYKSLTKEFAERLYKQHNTSNHSDEEWDANQVLNHKLVMFDPEINKLSTAQKLSSWLPQLQPEKWWGKIPIMVISSQSELPPKELTKGILVITSDMELKDVKKYFDSHLDTILKEK